MLSWERRQLFPKFSFIQHIKAQRFEKKTTKVWRSGAPLHYWDPTRKYLSITRVFFSFTCICNCVRVVLYQHKPSDPCHEKSLTNQPETYPCNFLNLTNKDNSVIANDRNLSHWKWCFVSVWLSKLSTKNVARTPPFTRWLELQSQRARSTPNLKQQSLHIIPLHLVKFI